MTDFILYSLIGINSFFLYWMYVHYKETLTLLDRHSYFIELLDYNNLSLEMYTKENPPSLEEEAFLHTLEQNLKEKAQVLGLDINFPERPINPND